MRQKLFKPAVRAISPTLCAVVLSVSGMPAAQAQSSVTIFGSLDVGITSTSNANGGRLTRLEQRHEPSSIGFRGREDLGDGLYGIFQLEGTISVDSGSFTNFDKQAYVGLSSNSWGTLTLGRNFDTIVDLVAVDPPRFHSVNAVHVGNLDRTAGNYLNNSVKYRSPTVNGFNGSLVYSLREDGTSATNAGTAYGASLNYVDARLRVSAAALALNGATIRPFNALGIDSMFGASFGGQVTKSIVVDQRIVGIGAYYDVAGWRLLGQVTLAELTANRVKEKLETVSVGFAKDPNGPLGFRPAAGIDYSTLNSSRWTTVFGILDYYFTKRTDIYIRVAAQAASGPNQKAALYLEGPSSGQRQTVIGAGITHRF